jgi:choline-sulfatase
LKQVSLTHPHDPYTIEEKYWDMYEDVDIELPTVNIPKEEQDPHSARLLKVCDLWDADISPEQIKNARRAYYGAVSYVDDCIGRILKTLKQCKLDSNTIIVFSGDHGDMLGERGLWYKMSYFESSVRVPLLVHYPQLFPKRHVSQNVSTLDILPTLVDLIGTKLWPELPIDGHSLFPYLVGGTGEDTVFAEYCGEGTVAPLVMIRRGKWKFIYCPADPTQLFNLEEDPHELANLAHKSSVVSDEAKSVLEGFLEETEKKWDFVAITKDVMKSQRSRRLVWSALKQGKFTSWDHDPIDDGREKYVPRFPSLFPTSSSPFLLASFPLLPSRSLDRASSPCPIPQSQPCFPCFTVY